MLWVKGQEGITALLAGARTLEQLEHILPVMEMVLSVHHGRSRRIAKSAAKPLDLTIQREQTAIF